MSVEKYLKPQVINQIKRLDLRAKFVVRGFLQGLHASPFHGFSVEFSEHRKYTHGDDPKDIDWLVFAKTDKYYVKKFEAETNISGMIVMDCSESMGYTYRQELTKFDYSICLAAALTYLMISQQDPIGLVTFQDKIINSLPPKSKRTQLGNMLSLLSKLKPEGKTDLSRSLQQIAGMLKHRTLIMVFTDLLEDQEPVFDSLYRLRHEGHDIILFHVLDEAEVTFPFSGMCELVDPETQNRLKVDSTAYRAAYQKRVEDFCKDTLEKCQKSQIDYVQIDTSMQFDRALMEYLHSRQLRC